MNEMKGFFWGKAMGLWMIVYALIAIQDSIFKYIAIVLFIYHIRYIIRYMAIYEIRFGIKTERVIAFYIDLCILVFIYAFILIVAKSSSYIFIVALSVFFIMCFFCRDGFTGQSIGKRLLGLEVVPLSAIRLFLRNITLLVWPLELVYFIIRGKRISDVILNCQVIKAQDKKHVHRRDAVKNAAIIAITTIVVSLIVANLKHLHSAWTLLY
ncbi:hypothetical protein, partial [Sodaliphilus pleomorphus]|uniref:hypothetical protein n=1 Tax=Sodaliphilus pleomorphus TaxID=2606626 RepID=UPI0024098A47